MPTVHSRTKTPRGTKTYTCATCHQAVEPGQQYYYWSRRFGRSGFTYYQHQTCGYPRPTQLSSAKTAVVQEAVNAAQTAIGEWDQAVPDDLDYDSVFLRAEGGGSYVIDVSDLQTALGDVASEARSVAEEYESGVGNMPDGLQQSPTAEAMTDVADRLNGWADELEDAVDEVEVEVPDPQEHDSEESWRSALEDAHANALDEARSAAGDKLDEMPEYEG